MSKKTKFGNFGPLIEHGPHWINFTIINFISENNRYFGGLYKLWNKIISFDMNKKVNGSPWSESLGFKCGTPIMLGPFNVFFFCLFVFFCEFI